MDEWTEFCYYSSSRGSGSGVVVVKGQRQYSVHYIEVEIGSLADDTLLLYY